MKKYIILPLIALINVSCQTIETVGKTLDQKGPCTQLDWYEIGRSDGVRGLVADSYKEKTDRCNGFSEADLQRYTNGWYVGVDEFCSTQNGFAFGRNGMEYLKTCPKAREKDFLKAYRKGKKVFDYEKDNQKIREELAKLEESTPAEQAGITAEQMKKINELETRLELNRAMISEIQREVDSSKRSL